MIGSKNNQGCDGSSGHRARCVAETSAGGGIWGQPKRCRDDKGFTLVELMVTLAVAVILMVIAVPSFKNIILSNKLTTTANDVVSALNFARTEAVKRNGNTQFCSDSSSANTSDPLGSGCGTQVGAVYVLIGNTATPVRSGTVGLTLPLKLNGSAAALRFSGDGLAHAVGVTAPFGLQVINICTSSLVTDNGRVIDMTGGSIVHITSKTETCP